MNIEYDGSNLHELVGQTIIRVDGLERGSEKVKFWFKNGVVLVMAHVPDCCETVDIEDVIGDPNDLVGSPLVLFEVAEGDAPPRPDDYDPECRYVESYSWTFVRIATARGHVDVRWYGESNGYYGERPQFYIPAAA